MQKQNDTGERGRFPGVAGSLGPADFAADIGEVIRADSIPQQEWGIVVDEQPGDRDHPDVSWIRTLCLD